MCCTPANKSGDMCQSCVNYLLITLEKKLFAWFNSEKILQYYTLQTCVKADTLLQWVLWDFRGTAKFERHLEPPVTNLLLCGDKF